MRLDGIHFLVTYRCVYACDHCFVWGGPDAESTMTLDQLSAVIDQAAECGVETVYFEGGEPTLAYPIVLAAAEHAGRRGLEFGVVTNCFWATSVADAKVWLAPFKTLGISDLSLSSYACFVEDADEDSLRNAVQAARELELPMAVLEVGAPAQLDMPGLCLGDDVGEIMHKGRAAVELAPARAHRPPQQLVTCPHEDLSSPGRAHVGCDGQLQLCQGVSAGNVFLGRDGVLDRPERSAAVRPRPGGLAAVLEEYDATARPIVRELLAGGPWALAETFGHRPRRELYADECHLCYEVRSALRSRHPTILTPAQCYGSATDREEDARAV